MCPVARALAQPAGISWELGSEEEETLSHRTVEHLVLLI